MFPYIHLFGKNIPMYSLMAFTGLLFAVGYILLRYKKSGLSRDDSFFAFIYGAAGALAGAKLLSIFTMLPQIIRNLDLLQTDPELFFQVFLYAGFVFYGGLYGALLGVWIYARHWKLAFFDFMDPLLPTVPIIHAWGRIGCFFMGCCYGIPVDAPWGVYFARSEIAPTDVALLPVQLYESAGVFVLAAVLIVLQYRHIQKRMQLAVYLLGYGVMRFVLEFFRYDAYRGFIGLLSISQVISVLTVIWGMALLIGQGLHVGRAEIRE